jgi:hypothetical protein
VSGTGPIGIGIFMYAPTAVIAAKSEANTIFLKFGALVVELKSVLLTMVG